MEILTNQYVAMETAHEEDAKLEFLAFVANQSTQ